MNGKSFIYGVLIGGAIAGVSTLLATPASGEKVRAKVKSAAKNIQLTAKDFKGGAIEVSDQITQALTQSKTTVTDAAKDLKGSIEQWQNSIKPHQISIQENIALLEQELEKLEKNILKKTK